MDGAPLLLLLLAGLLVWSFAGWLVVPRPCSSEALASVSATCGAVLAWPFALAWPLDAGAGEEGEGEESGASWSPARGAGVGGITLGSRASFSSCATSSSRVRASSRERVAEGTMGGTPEGARSGDLGRTRGTGLGPGRGAPTTPPGPWAGLPAPVPAGPSLEESGKESADAGRTAVLRPRPTNKGCARRECCWCWGWEEDEEAPLLLQVLLLVLQISGCLELAQALALRQCLEEAGQARAAGVVPCRIEPWQLGSCRPGAGLLQCAVAEWGGMLGWSEGGTGVHEEQGTAGHWGGSLCAPQHGGSSRGSPPHMPWLPAAPVAPALAGLTSPGQAA